MSLLEWFSIHHTLVTIPLGGGYAMSWIEAVGTLFGLACIWCASQEKTINYLFGLINVSLFAIIFFQIQLYGLLLLQLFFFCANLYGWYAWTRPANAQGDTLQIRWLSKSKLIATAAASVLAFHAAGQNESIWLKPFPTAGSATIRNSSAATLSPVPTRRTLALPAVLRTLIQPSNATTSTAATFFPASPIGTRRSM